MEKQQELSIQPTSNRFTEKFLIKIFNGEIAKNKAN
jgi:hypothetical protein